MEEQEYRTQAVKYLEKENFIHLNVKKEEVKNCEIKRYLVLLAILGEKKDYAEKFFERMHINFEGHQNINFTDENEIKFIKKLCDSCPYLFYFLEKQTGTIKDFTIALCGTGVVKDDNYSLDKAKFEVFLKTQLNGIVELAARHDLPLDHLEEAVKHVYDYFGF